MELKIEYINKEDLKPYANNAKIHTAEQVEQIKKSIEEFGFNDPIAIWHENEVVEGHGRLLAVMEMDNIKTVPVIRLYDLTDEQRRAYMLVHNKLTMNTDFDIDLVNIELGDIVDIDMAEFGFELAQEEDRPEIVEDEIPEETETRCNVGDLWQLGNHRLICGDSTDINVFKKLMGDEKADITVTSPPYNADHLDIPKSEDRGGGTQKSTQKKYLADNDKRTDDEYFDFLRGNIDILLSKSDEIFYNIGVGSGSKYTIGQLLNYYSNQFKDLIYWVKDNPMPVIIESVISSATELIICLGANGSRSFNHFGDRMFHGVINGLSASTSNKYADIHKATFPVYLPAEIIKRFTPVGGSVIDCFGGTGTTMVACEQLNRKCYMVELDPRYCDVIIQRWEDFTGQKAVKIDV